MTTPNLSVAQFDAISPRKDPELQSNCATEHPAERT